MRKAALAICLVGLLAASATGCIQHEGQLAIFLTNAATNNSQLAVSARQVNIDVTAIEVLEPQDRAFVTLSRGSQMYELIGLSNRTSLLAVADALKEGNYREIRLTFSPGTSSVIDDRGRRHDLSIQPSQVSVPALFTVVEDGSTNVVLEIDLEASLDLRANGNWILRPVIRQTDAEATTPLGGS